MGACRRMKIKHLGALVLLVAIFLYGVVHTLYLLSPALERLNHHIHPGEPTTHQGHRQLRQQGQGQYPGGHGYPHYNKLVTGGVGGSEGSRARSDNVLRYRVIVNKEAGGGAKGGIGRRQKQQKSKGLSIASVLLQTGRNQSKTGHKGPYQTANNNMNNRNFDGAGSDYCPQVRRPRAAGDSSSWVTVVSGRVHVFSAFYESRMWQPAVRVVALVVPAYRGNLSYCQVWTARAAHPEVVPLEADIVPEGHVDRKFAVYLLTCRLRSDRRPVAVSLVESRCQAPTILLPVLNTDSSRERRVDFSVCLAPLHFAYNDTRRLVETLELNRMFGAQRFHFYKYSIGPDVERYIQSYVKEGLAEVIPWRIPVNVDTWPTRAKRPDVHYFGQLAALNDCLYRNMYKSRYIVFSDMDEIIVPKAHNTWKELLGKLGREYKQKRFSKFGAFLFQCVFFRTDWSDDGNVTSLPAARKYNLLSLLKTKREKDVFPWGLRSKYIVDPLKIAMVGVHNVWRFIANRYMENNVPAELGLLHHYRYWAEPTQYPWVVDSSLHKYTDVILSRVRERHDIVPLPKRKRKKGKR